jgi:hypothetical protein
MGWESSRGAAPTGFWRAEFWPRPGRPGYTGCRQDQQTQSLRRHLDHAQNGGMNVERFRDTQERRKREHSRNGVQFGGVVLAKSEVGRTHPPRYTGIFTVSSR